VRSGDDADEARILVLLNVDDRPYRFPIDVGSLTVVAAPESEPRERPEPALVPAHSWTILAPAWP
jgi:cyclomaltodextrinase / maltogenic alpha-amylase / neopullulanase